MNDILAFGLLSFVSLFAVVEPLGLMPIFIGMTAKAAPSRQRSIAKRACLVAFITLVAFALTGQFVFRFFSISLESLKIVGGILFFMIGFEMLQAKHTRTAVDEHEQPESDEHDIAVTPLGIPMIAGPGAIANVTVRWNQADSIEKQAAVLISMTLVLIATLAILLSARKVAKFLGDAGNKVLLRLMGLITMVIAVEFFFSGLTPIVQKMLKPE